MTIETRYYCPKEGSFEKWNFELLGNGYSVLAGQPIHFTPEQWIAFELIPSFKQKIDNGEISLTPPSSDRPPPFPEKPKEEAIASETDSTPTSEVKESPTLKLDKPKAKKKDDASPI